jgi:putative SOS response-associated peptidase YedK
MLGCAVAGFAAIQVMALNAAIRGSILAVPDACLVMMMALNTINARAETIRTKPAFRQPFERRRCLVPATGWYEWQDLGKGKKKRPIHMCAKAEPFAFAGVWDVWKGAGGPGVTSFAIAIAAPAPSIAQYHDRARG